MRIIYKLLLLLLLLFIFFFWDSLGLVHASLLEKVLLPPSSDDVEAMAIAQKLGLSSVIFEGDSLVVINTLNSKEESLASYGHLLEVVLPSLVSFSFVSFSHVPRVGNNIAHNLTKYARHVRGLLIWMENVPSHFHAVLVADHG